MLFSFEPVRNHDPLLLESREGRRSETKEDAGSTVMHSVRSAVRTKIVMTDDKAHPKPPVVARKSTIILKFGESRSQPKHRSLHVFVHMCMLGLDPIGR